MDKLDEAVADFSKVIELNSKMALAYGNRGLTRLLQFKDEEAEADFQVTIKPDRRLKIALTDFIKEFKLRREANTRAR